MNDEKTPKLSHNVVIEYPSCGEITLQSVYAVHESWCKRAETQTKKWWAENIKEDWNILDIGAQVGMYSVLFSKKAPKGKIYCFEPTDSRKILQKNLEFVGAKNCELFPYAVGNRSGKVKDFVHMLWRRIKLEQNFDFITVDDFVENNKIEKLNGIKIDTDGYDPEVLYGCEKTLKKFDLSIIVELNPGALAMRGHTPKQAVEFMTSVGYELKEVLDSENYLFERKK